MSHTSRVVVLVDMDCFYCQVEEKLDPNLEGKPIAVVQYNEWRGGGIIAVNYPARDKGVTRHMRGDDAKQKCPEIILAKVPQVRGKADLSKYRDAGKRVADILHTFTPLLERASVDEAYLDITEAVEKRLKKDFDQIKIDNMRNTFVVGCDTEDFIMNVQRNREFSESNCRLAMGGLIVEQIRAEVLEKTGYKCSAGIAHNKILAKLVCGLHKPNKQTILPSDAITELYRDLPIKKIKSLGGKFGNTLAEELQITYMGELTQFSEKQLINKFDEKTGHWLYNIARGIDVEPVKVRLLSKSIGCCKKFPGKSALITYQNVEHWMNELATEMTERLEKDLEENNRKAKQMVISYAQEIDSENISSSRTQPLSSYEKSKILQGGLEVLNKFCRKPDGNYNITFLGISVGNFQDLKKGQDIATFFKNMVGKKFDENSPTSSKNQNKLMENVLNINASIDKPVRETEIGSADTLDNIPSEIGIIEENSDSHLSVYSASTEELDEDPKSLIYYEDMFPESVSSQPIFTYLDNLSKSTDECVPDKSRSSSVLSNIRKSSSQSFFAKYFENCPTDESSISKSSQENEPSTDENEENIEIVEESCCNGLERENDDIVDLYEVCPQCSKRVLTVDFVSHLDYHFALKIVKEEVHLYQRQQTSNTTRDNTEKKLGKKTSKKIPAGKPLLSFLKKGSEFSDNNSQICSKCDRRIKLEDFQNHLDYHEAINVTQEKVKSKQGVKRKTGANPLISFLKRSEELDDSNSTYCKECHKRVKLEEVCNHADFHAARKLHNEINYLPSCNKKIVTKKSNSISEFFKPS